MYANSVSEAADLVLTTFQKHERENARFLTEVRAGLTTFFTMAYIIAVNVRDNLTHLSSLLLITLVHLNISYWRDMCLRVENPRRPILL